MAYEDFRHLLKQQRAFAPELMTPTGRRVLARRSLPSRIWMATGKKVYNLITRGFFRWSDGEGTHDRIDREGPAIISDLKSMTGVSDVALAPFPLPSKGVGIYAFVETAVPEIIATVERTGADLVQPVAALPRRADGSPRDDILQLIAMNQLTELDALVAGDAALGTACPRHRRRPPQFLRSPHFAHGDHARALAKKQQSAVKVDVTDADGLKKPRSCGLIASIA